MTNMTLQAVRQLIANDSYAITFQSIEQYRASLLRHFDSLVEGPAVLHADSGAQATASIGDDPGFRAAAVRYAKAKLSETPDRWKLLVAAADAFAAAQPQGAQAVDGELTDDDKRLVARGMERWRKGLASECRLPPIGWHCTRADGHEGPCAAHRAKPEYGPDTPPRLRRPDESVADYRIAMGWAKPDERAQQAAAPGALLAILRDVHDTLASESDSDIDHFENDDEEREGAPVQYAARKVMEVMDILKAAAPSAAGTLEPLRELPPLPTPMARMYSQNGYRRASVSAGKGEPLFAADQMRDYARAAQLDGGQKGDEREAAVS